MAARARRRWLRWLLRGIAWLLAVTAVLLFVAVVSVRSDLARKILRQRLVAEVSSYLGRPLTVADADFSLLPPVLELRGVELAGPGAADPPVAEIERLRIEGAVLDPWHLRWKLRQVEVVRPRVQLEISDGGKLNLPLPEGRGGDAVRIDTLIVEDGSFGFAERRWPLTFTARDLRGRLVGDDPGSLHGQTTSAEVQVRLPLAEAYAVDLTVNGTVGPGRVSLEEVRVEGADVALRAAGDVLWGRALERETGSSEQTYRVDLQVAAHGSMSFLDRVGYLGGELAGDVSTEGTFTAVDEGWTYRGGVRSPHLDWLGRRFEAVAGVVRADEDAVRLSLERASYAGGTLSGWVVAEIEAPDYPVEADLSVQGLDLDRLLAVNGVGLSGFASTLEGDFNYRCLQRARDQGDGWGQFEVYPRAGPVAETGVALAGEVPLTIESGIATSQAVLLSAERQHVFFGGDVDFHRAVGTFDYEVDTEDAAELARLLLPYLGGGPQAGWVPQAGSGLVQGSLTLARDDPPKLTARLDLKKIETSEMIADTVRGGIQVEEGRVDNLSLEMTRGDGALLVTGSVDPEPGLAPQRRAEVELDFDAVAWPLGEIGYFKTLGLPLSGPVSGRLSLIGDGEELAGRLRATVVPARVADLPADEVRGELNWDSQGVDVRRLQVVAPAGTAEVRGTWVPATGHVDFVAEASLDLARQPLALLAGGQLGGRVEVSGTAGGSLGEPIVEARAKVSDLEVHGRSVTPAGADGGETTVRWDGRELVARGSLPGLLDFHGGGLFDATAADLDLTVESTGLGSLLELASDHTFTDLGGSFAGKLRVSGAPQHPASLEAILELDRLDARYRGLEIEELEPVRAGWRAGAVHVDSLYLGNRASDSELFVAGVFDPARERGLGLNLQGSLDTGWLAPLVTGLGVPAALALPGRLDLLGRLAGTPAEPYFDGQSELRLRPFVVPDLPQAVEDLVAVAAFYPERIELESLSATVGSGALKARGTAVLEPGGGVSGYRLYASADDLKLLLPDGWLQQGDAELWLSSGEDGRELQGLVQLEQARYLEDVDVGLAVALERLLQPQRQEVGSTNEWLSGTRLDVLIEAPRALRVRNAAANLRGDLDLELRGTLARPVLLGTVDLQPGGTLVYAGNDYRLERGHVTFANLYRTEPVVDLVATSRLRSYEVTLSLSGTPDRLAIDVSSDPPLPRLDLIALVAGGQPVDRDARPALPGSTDEGQLDAGAFLYGQAASAVTERVNTLFGFDKFRVDPLPKGTGNASSVRLTVGKRLNKDLFVTYSRDPSTTEEDILEAEWQVSPKLVLVFTQNGDGSFSVDALWDQRF
ncbi:MAG: translocation/assembly module TamB domain-containing protein [Acidobacteria bacterium]|nr:translocation/assembly module TamB domain-containing protein [Acidobacteriota bacterium]